MKHECLQKWRYVTYVREWNIILRQSKIYVTLVTRFLWKEQWYNLSITADEQRLNDMEGTDSNAYRHQDNAFVCIVILPSIWVSTQCSTLSKWFYGCVNP